MSETRLDEVVDSLRQRILSGEFGTGRLPTLRELAEQYTTSRETTGRAIKLLQAEGLLVSHGGKSVYIQSRARLPGAIGDQLSLLLQQQGLPAEETILEGPTSIFAPEDVARSLGIAFEAPVVHLLRRQGTTTVPYRLVEEFYPAFLAGEEILRRVQADPSLDILDAIGREQGKVVQQVHEDIITRVPVAREQRQLGITSSMPVLEMHRIGKTSDGMPILLHRIIFVGSLFAFSYDYETTRWSEQQKS